MQRMVEEEWLDSDAGSAEEIALNLDDMRRVNRFLGGNRMHLELLRKAAQRKTELTGSGALQIVEAASGKGDVLQFAAARLRGDGVQTEITLMDRSELHFPIAGDWDPALALPVLIPGDALSMPLGDQSMDVVSCSLFLHHLEPDEIRRFFAEALRVTRIGVIVNDLERGWRHLALSLAGRLFYKSRLSMHDGPVSVRRAYTYNELEEMVKTTGHAYEMRRMFLFRIGAVIWK